MTLCDSDSIPLLEIIRNLIRSEADKLMRSMIYLMLYQKTPRSTVLECYHDSFVPITEDAYRRPNKQGTR